MTQDRDIDSEFDASRDDTLLNSMLEEIFNSESPPDLKPRILAALAEREPEVQRPHIDRSVGDRSVGDRSVGTQAAVTELPQIQPDPTATSRRQKSPRWPMVAIVVGLALVFGMVTLLPRFTGRDVAQPVGDQRLPNTRQSDPNTPVLSDDALVRDGGNTNAFDGSVDVEVWDDDSSTAVVDDRLVETDPRPGLEGSRDQLQPGSRKEIVDFIDEALARRWQQAGVKVARSVDDNQWCDRVFRRLLGRSPTPDEYQAFRTSRESRAQLVQRLVNADEYRSELAANWSSLWTNILLGSDTPADGLADRGGLEQYLTEAFASGVPFNELASELITAEGSNQPGAADFNGATNFLLDGLDDRAELATTRVAHVFLGRQLSCVQCHDHPTKDWGQSQYWEMNAFFRQMEIHEDADVQLTNVDFAGEGKVKTADRAEIYYQQPNKELKSAFPRFLGRWSPASQSGRLADIDRRAELARFVTQSDEFSRTLVNRLWGHFLGRGLAPLGNIDGSVSHPEVLDRLSDEFTAHKFDLRQVMVWLASTDAFGLASDPTDSDAGREGQRLFASYQGRVAEPSEVVDSLTLVAQARRGIVSGVSDSGRPEQLNARKDADLDASYKAGLSAIRTLGQRFVQKSFSPADQDFLQRLDKSKLSTDQRVQHIFNAALSRDASAKELAEIKKMNANQRKSIVILEDIWWTLLHTDEYMISQ